MFASPVIPECIKVESPITATDFFSASAPFALLDVYKRQYQNSYECHPVHRKNGGNSRPKGKAPIDCQVGRIQHLKR